MRQHHMTVQETMEGKRCCYQTIACPSVHQYGFFAHEYPCITVLLRCVCINRIRHVRRGCLLNTFTGLNVLTVVIALGVAASQILVIVQLSDLPRKYDVSTLSTPYSLCLLLKTTLKAVLVTDQPCSALLLQLLQPRA
jgi:hypothetical protein